MDTMKRNSSESLSGKLASNQSSNGSKTAATPDLLKQGDPVWELLGEATERKADTFFARNIVRQTRELSEASPTWSQRLIEIFSTKKILLPIAAAACIGVVAVTQFNSEQPTINQPAKVADTVPVEDSSTALAELVIEESLVAAAEDPTQFTHDEVVAMIGL
jgi:hypothetical protein